MNLLKANVSTDDIANNESLRKNNEFCGKIMQMIRETYDCVVKSERSQKQVTYSVGKPGDRDIYGGQIYQMHLTATFDGDV